MADMMISPDFSVVIDMFCFCFLFALNLIVELM